MDHKASKKKIIMITAILFFCLAILAMLPLLKKEQTGNRNGYPLPTRVPIYGKPVVDLDKIPQPNVKKTTQDANTLGKITFSFPEKDLLSENTIYSIVPSKTQGETVDKFEKALLPGGVKRTIDTPKGKVLLINRDGKMLTFYLDSEIIVYSTSAEPSSGTLSLDQLKDDASKILHSLEIFNPSDPTVSYYSSKTSDLIIESELSSASLVELLYSELLNSNTVYKQYGNSSQVAVVLDKSGRLIKLTYKLPPTYSPQHHVQLYSLDDAKRLILEGKGTVVKYGQDYHENELQSPTSTNFTTFDSGLFEDQQNKLLYPVFVFSGFSQNATGQYPIIVYLPARAK